MDLSEVLVSFALGVVSSYLGLYWKVRKELEADYDKDLRANRFRAYATLWRALQPLAKYARPAPLNAGSSEAMSVELRRWYFEEGGIYLSERARDAYFRLQNEIQSVLSRYRGTDHELKEPDFEGLRRTGSLLRTAMTLDLGSRKPPIIGGERAE